MQGVVIPKTKIIIDSDEPDPEDGYYHFLSCVHLESNYDFETMRKRALIFTSEFNMWFLVKFHGFDPRQFYTWREDQSLDIIMEDVNISMQVKIIDSNHCAGSVMFLFEGKGSVGNYLYAGNFRYYDKLLDAPALQRYRFKHDTLNILYLHSQFPFEKCPSFAPKTSVMLDILKFAMDCKDQHLIFVSPHVGNEELYVAISQELQETIYINSSRLKTLKYLQLENHFTSDDDEAQIWVLNIAELKGKHLCSLNHPYQIVSLSCDQDLGFLSERISYFPYHTYSSRGELHEFITTLQPLAGILTIFRTQHEHTSSASEGESSCPNSIQQKIKFRVFEQRNGTENNNVEMVVRTTHDLSLQKDITEVLAVEENAQIYRPGIHNDHGKQKKVPNSSKQVAQRALNINDMSGWSDISPIGTPGKMVVKLSSESSETLAKISVRHPIESQDKTSAKSKHTAGFQTCSIGTPDKMVKIPSERSETLAKTNVRHPIEFQDKTSAKSRQTECQACSKIAEEAKRKLEEYWDEFTGLDLYLEDPEVNFS